MDNMDLERHIMESVIDEIKMAEKYLKMAREADAQHALKFQELAKDNIRHYDFLKTTLNAKIGTKTNADSIKAHLLQEVYDKWTEEVRHKVMDFKVR